MIIKLLLICLPLTKRLFLNERKKIIDLIETYFGSLSKKAKVFYNVIFTYPLLILCLCLSFQYQEEEITFTSKNHNLTKYIKPLSYRVHSFGDQNVSAFLIACPDVMWEDWMSCFNFEGDKEIT